MLSLEPALNLKWMFARIKLSFKFNFAISGNNIEFILDKYQVGNTPQNYKKVLFKVSFFREKDGVVRPNKTLPQSRSTNSSKFLNSLVQLILMF